MLCICWGSVWFFAYVGGLFGSLHVLWICLVLCMCWGSVRCLHVLGICLLLTRQINLGRGLCEAAIAGREVRHS